MPRLFDIVKGKVANIKEYGAFITIDGSTRQGLLHRTQISRHPVERVDDVLDIGEELYCKVVSMQDGKIALSMKLVDQTTGRDKDPDHLAAERIDEQRRGRPRDNYSPIRNSSGFNTVCKRCGVRGHYASNCYNSTSGNRRSGMGRSRGSSFSRSRSRSPVRNDQRRMQRNARSRSRSIDLPVSNSDSRRRQRNVPDQDSKYNDSRDGKRSVNRQLSRESPRPRPREEKTRRTMDSDSGRHSRTKISDDRRDDTRYRNNKSDRDSRSDRRH